MLFYVLIVHITCSIPYKFSNLVSKIMANSKVKIPKKDRETTKYHGKYSFQNIHFTLHKDLASLRTNDIKGFAIEGNFAAILKRKNYKIDDGFVFFEHKTQKFYLMERTVAFDDQINIYKVRPVEIFQVFSDFEFKGKSPLMTFQENFNWDTRTNHPKLNNFENISIGTGTFLKASFNTKVHLVSLKKAEIATDVTLDGKVGTEIKINKTEFIRYQNISIINDMNRIIPGLSTSFTFMGLEFNFEVSLTFSSILRNLVAKLQADVDCYKWFQFTSKRYISIKCHGVSDSGWQTDFSPMHIQNLVDGNTSNFEASKLSSLIEINQGIRLKATVASNIKFDLQFGLLEPFKVDYEYKPLICPFPYLYGNSELQLNSYLHFSGIELSTNIFGKEITYKLLNEIHKDSYLFHNLTIRKRCLFDSRSNIDHTIIEFDNNFDDDQSNEDINRAIVLEVNNIENVLMSKSLISFQPSIFELNLSTNTQSQIFNRRATIYDIYQKSDFDQIIIQNGLNHYTSKVAFNFFYYTGMNKIEKSNELSFLLKDHLENGEEFSRIPIYNPKKTEEIWFDFRLNYCEILPFNEMYVPALQNGIISNDIQIRDKICVIVKDDDSYIPDYVDESAIFTTDGTLSRYLSDKGIFEYKDEFFQFQLNSVTFPYEPEPDSNVNYEVRAEWGENYQEKILLISNFTNKFTKGTNIIYDKYMPKIRITKEMRLMIYITYVHNYNVISMNQPITLSDIIKVVDSNEQTMVKTQSNKKISCAITFQRYKPTILLNCTKKNSSHRIITNVYSLNAYTPSEYKSQVIKFKDNLKYGVLKIKRIHENNKWLIIHMPFLQPLCNFTIISDEYYQIPIYKDTVYIPFRKENTSMNEVTINHIIQGNFLEDETIYFENKYYPVNFDKTPVVIAFVRTINNQYSIAGIENTKQTLIDYGNEIFKILVLSYGKDKNINIASTLVIIDENTPYIEKRIPNFSKLKTVVYHVLCQRADAIMIHDKTTRQTTENNIIKEGSLFKVTVKPDHIIDFIPVCKNLSQPMCFIKQRFSDKNGYAVLRYPNKNGITILDTTVDDIFGEDWQGLIEEIIPKNKEFYFMTTFNNFTQITRTYTEKTELELRIIEVKNEKIMFCIVDRDGHFVPPSRSYYTDEFYNFIDELGIKNNVQFIDLTTGEFDSCIYAKYDISNQNDTNIKKSAKNILSNPIKSLPNPSTKICDLAESFKVIYYQDIKQLVPPASFELDIYSIKKVFEDLWALDVNKLQYEIDEYFTRAKKRIKPEHNNYIFCLYLPYNEIIYNNELKEDEYISANRNITIHYLGGILNYLLPEKYHTIIDISDSNEININLNGKGTLEFQSKDQSKIKINGQINLDSKKAILVNNNVKIVEIESVNIAGFAELHVINKANESVELKIGNLLLLEHSRLNLTNVEILKQIIIKQTATAFVDSTVKFSDSELFIDLKFYQNDLIPMISGNLPDPPKKIHIQRSIENQVPKLEEEYIFFDGKFDCQLWSNNLDFGNSYFNTARCSQLNNTESNLLSIDAIGLLVSLIEIALPLSNVVSHPMLFLAITFFLVGTIVIVVDVVICCKGTKKEGVGNSP